jgi:hypothetical protein
MKKHEQSEEIKKNTLTEKMKKNKRTEEIIERLEKYVIQRGDNYARLTMTIGVSVGYFSRMRKVKGSLGSEILSRILTYYGDLSADWLLTGHGNMLKGSQPISYVQNFSEREKMLKDIAKTIETFEQNIVRLKEQYAKLNRLLH